MCEKNILNDNIEKLNKTLSKKYVIEFIDLLGNKKLFYFRNFLAGIIKGVGAGIGFTLITAIFILFLKKIVTLNIPIIGNFVTDLVEIVNTKIYK